MTYTIKGLPRARFAELFASTMPRWPRAARAA